MNYSLHWPAGRGRLSLSFLTHFLTFFTRRSGRGGSRNPGGGGHMRCQLQLASSKGKAGAAVRWSTKRSRPRLVTPAKETTQPGFSFNFVSQLFCRDKYYYYLNTALSHLWGLSFRIVPIKKICHAQIDRQIDRRRRYADDIVAMIRRSTRPAGRARAAISMAIGCRRGRRESWLEWRGGASRANQHDGQKCNARAGNPRMACGRPPTLTNRLFFQSASR